MPVMCIRLLAEAEPSVQVAFGSTVKPQFETLVRTQHTNPSKPNRAQKEVLCGGLGLVNFPLWASNF